MIDALFPIIAFIALGSWLYAMVSIYDAVRDLKIEGKWIFLMAPYLLFIGNEYNIEPKKKNRILMGVGLFIGALGGPFLINIIDKFI